MRSHFDSIWLTYLTGNSKKKYIIKYIEPLASILSPHPDDSNEVDYLGIRSQLETGYLGCILTLNEPKTLMKMLSIFTVSATIYQQ